MPPRYSVSVQLAKWVAGAESGNWAESSTLASAFHDFRSDAWQNCGFQSMPSTANSDLLRVLTLQIKMNKQRLVLLCAFQRVSSRDRYTEGAAVCSAKSQSRREDMIGSCKVVLPRMEVHGKIDSKLCYREHFTHCAKEVKSRYGLRRFNLVFERALAATGSKELLPRGLMSRLAGHFQENGVLELSLCCS